MADFQIILPDNSVKSFDHAPTSLEVAESIGPRLAKDTLSGKVNGELVDFRIPLASGTRLEIVTTKSPDALEVVRHSAAHVMAQAVQEIWPDVKVTIGPVIEAGFYYDFVSPRPFTPEDLVAIEKRMEEIVKRDLPILREEWPVQTAIETFRKLGEHFKVEIIEDLVRDQGITSVSVYRQGEWFDLCRGPHVPKTGFVKAVKVLSLAGAYWRGDETKQQLQRIYATAFLDKKELEQHLQRLEEAKKRDHRRIGKDLGLFYFHQVAPGAPFFTGKGSIIYNELTQYIRELYVREDYEEVITPQLFEMSLFKQSGHYDNYRENMYKLEIDEREYGAKPMNCPGHCILYGADKHSYRDLPKRMADFGRLHRYERSGVMHGLTRVRSFCQDDAHIFCRPDQVQSEIEKFIRLSAEVYATLGMPKYKLWLATRPAKRAGTDEIWDQAEAALQNGLEKLGLPFTMNPGEGAFYGPKIEVQFFDAIERPWQLGTIQADFVLPENFNLTYVGEDNSEHRPVMLHRAILGSLERFIGVYLEHTAGVLPFWLSPLQVRILPVTDKHLEYAGLLERELKTAGLRVTVDRRNEKLGFKIREAQLERVPYAFIIGDKEVDHKTVSIRRFGGAQRDGLTIEEMKTGLLAEKTTRSLQSLLFSAEAPKPEAQEASH
jgi:threonyl-tRNA synthetase